MQQDESSTLRQPLPDRWIARIFQELQGNYGSRFLNQWKTGQQSPDGEDIGIKNAMATWAKKLGGFADMSDAIKAVLDYLPSDPPSLPEFVNLCREAGRRLSENVKRIEYVPTEEEKQRAAYAAKAASKAITKDKRDHKEWAKKLKERHADGEALSLVQIDAYREALTESEDDPQVEALAA